MGTVTDALFECHKNNRETLLSNITKTLEQDSRVETVWLLGSLGRGEQDYLSDIDIFLVISDQHWDEIIDSKHNFISRISSPIIIMEAPQNAPPGGAYLAVCYDSSTGPLTVDWYWLKQSEAKIPEQTKILFNRNPLPKMNDVFMWDYQPIPEQTPLEKAYLKINSFWWGIPHAAKYLVRSPWEWGKESNMKGIIQSLMDLYRYFDTAPPHLHRETFDTPEEKLKLLYWLAQQAEELEPAVIAQGVRVPKETAPSVYRFLDLVGFYLKKSIV